MKYNIEVGGQEYTVELKLENGRGVAHIDDHSIEFDLSEPEPGVYTLLLGNRVVEVRLVNNQPESLLEAILRDQRLWLRRLDLRQRRRRASLSLTGKIELKATMPGRVVDWLCQPGERVSQGQGVVVVEAMKMQNDVRSPKAGVVAELRVKPGARVSAGEVLAVIE